MATTPNLKRAIGNEVSTTLSASLSDSATSLTVTDATGFSTSGGAVIIDENVSGKEEVVYVESVSGNTFTIASDGRGQAGTSAVSHDSGATVTDILETDHINGIIDTFEQEHDDDGGHNDINADSVTSSGNIDISTNNSSALRQEDSGGTARNIAYIDASDVLHMGASALAGIVFDKEIYKIGTFTVNSTGSKAVTGVGFKPSLVIFFPLNNDGVSMGRNTSFNIGYMDDSNQLAHSSVVRDDVGSGSDTDTSSCIMIQTVSLGGVALSPTLQASKTSLDSDGFTVNVTAYNPGPFDVLYLALS